MAHTDVWNVAFNADPADLDDIGDGAQDIRTLKRAISERMLKDHYFDPNGTNDDHGEHMSITMRAQAADPTGSSGKGKLFGSNVANITELIYKDDANTSVQLTSNGRIGASQGGRFSNIIGYTDASIISLCGLTINAAVLGTNNCVPTAALQPNCVNNTKISNNAIIPRHVTDNCIGPQHILPKSLTLSHIANAIVSPITIMSFNDGTIANSKLYTLRTEIGYLTYSNATPISSPIYIHSSASSLNLRMTISCTAVGAVFKVGIGSIESSNISMNLTPVTTALTLNVSSLSGWQDLKIQGVFNTAGADPYYYMFIHALGSYLS